MDDINGQYVCSSLFDDDIRYLCDRLKLDTNYWLSENETCGTVYLDLAQLALEELSEVYEWFEGDMFLMN